MPFLTLNGVTIPTKAGGQTKFTEYGERTAGFDGSAQIDVRARKREWEFTTKPISHVRARAIDGLVQGTGLYLPWDFYSGANTGYYAANGVNASSVSGTSLGSSYGADGTFSYDEKGVIGALVGQTSLSFDYASTNLFSSAMASCSSLTGFTQFTGTYSVDTAHFWEGTSSIKCVPAGLAMELDITRTGSYAAGSTYTFSTYVWVSGTASIEIGMFDVTNNQSLNFTFFNSLGSHGAGWYRMSITATFVSASTSLKMFLATSNLRFPVWFDGMQFETGTSSGSPTTWQAGGASRPNSTLTYPFNYYNPSGLTFSAWYAGNPFRTDGTSAVFFHLNDAANVIMETECFLGGQFNTYVNTTVGQQGVQVINTNVSQWNHFVATYYPNPFTNSQGVTFPNLNIYMNGVLGASTVVTGKITTPANIDIGQAYGGYNFMGRMDDVQVLPYCVDDNWVAQTYAASINNSPGSYGQTGLTPFLTMAGDGIDGAPITVHGSVKQSTYVGFQDPKYGWISQGRSLQLLLTEV